MADEQTTQYLLDRMDGGDSRAGRELIERSYERLRHLARKTLHTSFVDLTRSHDVDSVVNQAVLRLMASLRAVRPRTGPDFFRFAAVQLRRVLLDLIRLQRKADARRAGGPRPDDPSGGPADAGPAGLNPALLAQWGEFHEKIEKLPDDLRLVVDLHWYCGLSQAETAQQLGVHEKEVSRRWLRARRHIAEWLPSDG
jgi:DNA-directed RNA polymerase specialized sigma24 family protein